MIPGAERNYNALNARVSKFMGHGLTINGVFEWSRLLGTFNQLNAGRPAELWRELLPIIRSTLPATERIKFPLAADGNSSVNDNRIVDGVVGGWQVSAIYQFLSGMRVPWGNAIYTGSGWKDFNNAPAQRSRRDWRPSRLQHRRVRYSHLREWRDQAADNDPSLTGFNPNIQPGTYNFRTFPAYLMRQDYTSNWDANVQKDIKGWENVSIFNCVLTASTCSTGRSTTRRTSAQRPACSARDRHLQRHQCPTIPGGRTRIVLAISGKLRNASTFSAQSPNC